MGNVGPGFGRLFNDLHSLPALSKMVLFFCMWLRRLEIVLIFLLFVPEFLKK
jgi:Trk-type K+ transport system membrane component